MQTEIEESDVTEEQIDAMYYRYGQLLLPSPLEPIFYKHYIIDDAKDLKPGVTFDSVITIEENNSIVSEGTTGLHTWEVSILFSLTHLELALLYYIIVVTYLANICFVLGWCSIRSLVFQKPR